MGEMLASCAACACACGTRPARSNLRRACGGAVVWHRGGCAKTANRWMNSKPPLRTECGVG
eukprot:15479434-Alexandrium_andersonii.AAC.1